MKKNFTSFLLFLLILINRMNFPQFELRYPDLPQDQINDIVFLNDSKGFFINDGGSVLMTEDGGVTWNIVAHFQRNTFSQIKFIDENNGFAVSPYSHIGDDISFIFTTDGGFNWSAGNVYMGDALTFLPISESAILKSLEYDGTINKLDNFFGNWVQTYTIPYFWNGDLQSPYGDILQFQKLPGDRILALGSSWRAKAANFISDSVSFILKSDDLGSTWDTLWCDFSFASQAFAFANSSIGWLGSEHSRIYKSTNGGISWQLKYSDTLNNFSIKSISSPDTNSIFAVNGNGKVIYSLNGGVDWNENQIGQGFDSFFNIYFLNQSKGFLSGYDSLGSNFWLTNNGGNTWERVSKSLRGNLRSIDFINENIGIGVGSNFVYKTKDGGKNWKILYESTSDNFSDVKFISQDTVWVVGYDSVYKSINGGNTWDSFVLQDNIEFMRGIEFLNSNIGVIFEVKRNLNDTTFNYVTFDGGVTWKPYPIDYMFLTSFFKLKFTDPGHLWFVNQQGVWLSKDTAKTWEIINNEGSLFSAFDFIDSLTGVYIPDHDIINYSTDGGATWDVKDKPYPNQSTDVFIYGPDHSGRNRVLIGGLDGSLIRYILNDVFIYQIPTYTSKYLFNFASYRSGNKIHIWLGGDGMTLLYEEQFITSINDNEEEKINFSLSQNYPNPFNPTTKIKYSIPNVETYRDASLQIVLKIYDVLGKEVATLVNEEKLPGVYEVEFNPVSGIWNLASGIYYYRIKAGDFIETKKMIYLK